MNFLIFASIFLLASFSIVKAQDETIPGKYHWKNRILLVYADTENSVSYQKQLEEFEKHKKGMADRDLVIFSIFPNRVVDPESHEMGEEVALHLRRRYSVSSEGLTVVLLGKDGGEKLTKPDFLSVKQLFGIIDQMPMRQREMRKQHSG